MRAWARDNGYEISERGRLSADVQEAYAAAHGGRARKSAAKAPAKAAKAPARKAAPAKKAGSTRAVSKRVVAAPAEQPSVHERPEQQAPGSAPVTDPTTKQQSGAPEDRRLIALAEQISALTARVDKLEKAQGSEKPSRFGRRKSR